MVQRREFDPIFLAAKVPSPAKDTISDEQAQAHAAARTKTSGRFVAATTITPESSSTPSISFNRLVSTPADGPSWPSPRAVASASISSCGKILVETSLDAKKAGGTHKEHDGWRCCASFAKDFSNGAFTFADEFVQKLARVFR